MMQGSFHGKVHTHRDGAQDGLELELWLHLMSTLRALLAVLHEALPFALFDLAMYMQIATNPLTCILRITRYGWPLMLHIVT